MSLAELATTALYSLEHSQHITAESTYQVKSNAYSFGCSFAEVEVDIPLCKVKLVNMINVHDCGRLINPALAAAQVQKNLSTLEEAHASLDELKKNIVRTTDEFVGEVDELIASLNDAREQISSNTVAALGSKEQFDEVYNSIVKG